MKIEGLPELFQFEGFIIDKITCSPEFVQITQHRDQWRKNALSALSASEVSQISPFSDDTIRRWDKQVLEEWFGEIDLTNVTKLLFDAQPQAVGYQLRLASMVRESLPRLTVIASLFTGRYQRTS